MKDTKEVTRTYPESDYASAHKDLARFQRIGGKVTQGISLEAGEYTWKGVIRVYDDSKSVAGDFPCGRCSQTGQFITYIENNVPKGPGGICFRCGGKGFHNLDDRKRNHYADMHRIVRGIV